MACIRGPLGASDRNRPGSGLQGGFLLHVNLLRFKVARYRLLCYNTALAERLGKVEGDRSMYEKPLTIPC
jgi:hypothetical protein